MLGTMKIERKVVFRNKAKGRRYQNPGSGGGPGTPGRVPRVARLMALAIRFEGLVRDGTVTDYAELATLGHVTRARMTQVMNLLCLAPDIQEAVLFLPRTENGRDPLIIAQLQPIAAQLDWGRQRRLWADLVAMMAGKAALQGSN
jgi:hypothetical protein